MDKGLGYSEEWLGLKNERAFEWDMDDGKVGFKSACVSMVRSVSESILNDMVLRARITTTSNHPILWREIFDEWTKTHTMSNVLTTRPLVSGVVWRYEAKVIGWLNVCIEKCCIQFHKQSNSCAKKLPYTQKFIDLH